jgi:hypothetical protein
MFTCVRLAGDIDIFADRAEQNAAKDYIETIDEVIAREPMRRPARRTALRAPTPRNPQEMGGGRATNAGGTPERLRKPKSRQ